MCSAEVNAPSDGAKHATSYSTDRKKRNHRSRGGLRNLRTQHRVLTDSFGNHHDYTLARTVIVARVEVHMTIDGLKLTFSGGELRKLLEERIAGHQRAAERWTHEKSRTPEDETEDAPLLPEHICTNEAERHEWRAEVLQFIRDHVETGDTYQLSASDLEIGELLPSKPGWLEQDEYEERTRIGFMLERATKTLLVPIWEFLRTRAATRRGDWLSPPAISPVRQR
jgi:hypothetical protein